MQVAIRFLPKSNERPALIKLHDERVKNSNRPEPAWVAQFWKRLSQ